jgi:ABC-type multidrug transport system permease subunit
MAPSAVFILALVIYTGFAIPVGDMHPWFRWLNYLDPVAYAFEALMINEVGIYPPPFVPAVLIFVVVSRPANTVLQLYTGWITGISQRGSGSARLLTNRGCTWCRLC